MANENNPVTTRARVETRAVTAVRTAVIAMLIGAIGFAAGMIIGSSLFRTQINEGFNTINAAQSPEEAFRRCRALGLSIEFCDDFATNPGRPYYH